MLPDHYIAYIAHARCGDVIISAVTLDDGRYSVTALTPEDGETYVILKKEFDTVAEALTCFGQFIVDEYAGA